MPKKIMVVEDDLLIMQLLRYQLGGAGYDVIIAPNGLRALERVLLDAPDLILLDVTMPELNGWDSCRQIRACSSVPIIMLTAKSEDQDVITGLTAGADDYVTKPFTLPVLLARVEALLRRSAASQAQPINSVPRDNAADLGAATISTLDARSSSREQPPSMPSRSVPSDSVPTHAATPSAPSQTLPPNHVGRQLRQARLNQGATLLQVSQKCAVHWEFLQALEQENFTYMPRAELRRSLRLYCSYLGLDVYALTGQQATPKRPRSYVSPRSGCDVGSHDCSDREYGCGSAVARHMLQ